MAAQLDNVQFTPTAGGTTDWTYSLANSGYQSPTAANVTNGLTYESFAKDGSGNWEISRGACSISGGIPTFARTTVLYNSAGTGTLTPGQSGAGTKINFASAPAVSVVLIKESHIAVDEANSFTATQQTQARTNIGAVGDVKIQKFTASGTYTPSTGMLYCVVEIQAAGGGSGGTTGNSTSCVMGQSGGGGEYTRTRLTAAQIGASQTVTIGAAGTAGAAAGAGGNASDSSLGTLATAKGGKGGIAGTSGGAALNSVAAGGSGGTGDFAIPGQAGVAGLAITGSSNVFLPSIGGNSFMGTGGVTSNGGGGIATNGVAGNNYGGGAAGGISQATSSNATGASGGAAVIIITEYCAS